MANSEVFELDPSAERGAERSSIRWDWLLVFTVAWILFDIFTEPVLAVAVASFKFGWNDLANGIWLKNRDPDAPRGHTHFVFYVAAAFWRISVMTLVIVVGGHLLAGLSAGLNGPRQQNDPAGRHMTSMAAVIIGVCFVLSSLTSWLAILVAWRRRHKVWLHSDVRLDRVQKLWPPRPFGRNELSRVITSSLLFFVVSVDLVGLAFLGKAARDDNPWAWLYTTILVFGIVGATAFALVVRSRTVKLLPASSPNEAWPEREFEGDNAGPVD